jgi:hypothetical protein
MGESNRMMIIPAVRAKFYNADAQPTREQAEDEKKERGAAGRPEAICSAASKF